MSLLEVIALHAADAERAEAGGADRIGLSAARGPLSVESVSAILAAVARSCPVSASPDVFGDHDVMQAAGALAEAGVDALEFDHDGELIERATDAEALVVTNLP